MALLDSIMRDVVQTVGDTLGVKATDSTPAILRRTQTNYDPENDANATEITEQKVTVFPPESFSIRDIDGEKIKAGDMKIRVPAKQLQWEPIDPDLDTLVFNGITYSIVTASPTFVGAQAADYVLQCRR